MDVEAGELHARRGGVEVLVLDLAEGRAVERVGELRAEALKVHQRRAVADLLVRAKADAHRAVGHVGSKQPLGHGHDLRHAGLVVCAEDGGAVGDDEGLAAEGGEMGEGGGAQRAPARAQLDVAAVVVLDHAGLDVLAGEIGDGVNVGEEADAGLVLQARRGGQGGVDVAVLVHVHVLRAELVQLPLQDVRKIKLPLGRGGGRAVLNAGGVHLRILDQPLVGSLSGHDSRSFLMRFCRCGHFSLRL